MNQPSNSQIDHLSNILIACNSGLKVTTLLHLDSNTPMDRNMIRREVIETAGTKSFIPTASCFGSYCNSILVPLGYASSNALTSYKKHPNSPVQGYKLTSFADRYIKPISAFMMDWAIQNETDLYSALGGGQINGNGNGHLHGPLGRIRILEELAEAEELRITDLANKTKLPRKVVARHLDSLELANFISYSSVGTIRERREEFVFEFVDKDTPFQAVKGLISATPAVYEELKRVGRARYTEIASNIGLASTSVGSILRGLEKQGHAKRKNGFNVTKQSSIKINNPGIGFLVNLALPIRQALLDETELNKIRVEYLCQLESDAELRKDYIRKVMGQYYRNSSAINKHPKRETAKIILELIREEPEIGIKCLNTKLRERRVALDSNTLQAHLKRLRDSERILSKEGHHSILSE